MAFNQTLYSYSVLDNLKLRMSIPYYENQIYPDAFTFNSTTGIIHVNSTSEKPGYLVENFYNLELGDIIEITAEFRVLSGTGPKIAFDEYIDASTSQNTEYTQVKRVGEWETLKAKYVFRDLKGFKKLRTSIGLWTKDSGEYQMRNVRTLVKSKRNTEGEKSKASFSLKPYVIRKNGTIWEIRTDFAHSEGSLERVSSKVLKVKFGESFSNRPAASISSDFYMDSYKYHITVGNLQKDSAYIQIYDNATNTLQELDAIPDGMHFSLVFVG
ncbi:hypothetical protein ACS52_11330 [Bacillus cereus]|nr:hypothetical protein ACS52_11330 [Bacillus cereus]